MSLLNQKLLLPETLRASEMWGQVVDSNGGPVGELFRLDMEYDQARAAFTNTNVPVAVADRSAVVTSVYLYGPDKETQLAWVSLDRTARLVTRDSISFERGGICLGLDPNVVVPGLHVIEEEACIEDAF